MTAADFNDLCFSVVDVEGNGQQPPEIVEIAIVHLDGLTVVGEPLTWLVKPSRPITPLVTRKVHGIRDADLAHAPGFDQIAEEVLAALGDRTPVAHNARVEHEVIGRHLPQWRPTLMLDTLRLARKVWPGLGSYSLDVLLAHANIGIGSIPGQRHRAGFDAQATAGLFAVLAEAAGSREQLYTWAGLPGLTPIDDQEGLW